MVQFYNIAYFLNKVNILGENLFKFKGKLRNTYLANSEPRWMEYITWNI